MCESNKIVQFDAMTVLTSFDSSIFGPTRLKQMLTQDAKRTTADSNARLFHDVLA
jgi:hypothetical protein